MYDVIVGERPLAEAISSAGGVRWNELDTGLMLRRLSGVFVAGDAVADHQGPSPLGRVVEVIPRNASASPAVTADSTL